MHFAMKKGQICFPLRKILAISSAIQKIASDCGCDAAVHLVLGYSQQVFRGLLPRVPKEIAGAPGVLLRVLFLVKDKNQSPSEDPVDFVLGRGTTIFCWGLLHAAPGTWGRPRRGSSSCYCGVQNYSVSGFIITAGFLSRAGAETPLRRVLSETLSGVYSQKVFRGLLPRVPGKKWGGAPGRAPESAIPSFFNLVAPYCAIPRDYLSDTPILRAMGFLVSQHGQLGAIPPPLF